MTREQQNQSPLEWAGEHHLLLALAVYRLHLSGKMDVKSMAGFAVLTVAVLLVNSIGWGMYFRRTLSPRRKRLEAFVAALGE